MTQSLIGIISLIALIGLCSSTTFLRVDKNRLLKDKDGRYRLYHGVNVVYKLPPFVPPITTHFHVNDSFSAQDASYLQGWGFNVIRLFVSWEAMEPERGKFELGYLEKLREIIKIANAFNISVLLDAHQDLLSRQFCGEGAPSWSMIDFDFPKPLHYKIRKDENGDPLWEDCLKHQFATMYLSKAVSTNWLRLFGNAEGIADEFGQMWAYTVQALKNEPNIIGYEIINEPFGSSLYRKPYQVPWDNNLYLLPFYRKINNIIRQYDNDTLVFFEPSLTDYIFGTGFKSNVGGKDYRNREVYSYHIYCPLVNKQGEPKSPFWCQIFDKLFFKQKNRTVRKLKIGGFLTEFGALNNSTKSANEIAVVTQQAEKRFQSWTYWQYQYYSDITTAARPGTTESFWDIYGGLNTGKIKALARPYVYAICGSPLQTAFNPTSAQFTFSFKANSLCNGLQSEVFLSNNFYYPNGFNFVCSANCKLNPIKNMPVGYYEIEFPLSFNQGSKVQISVTPV